MAGQNYRAEKSGTGSQGKLPMVWVTSATNEPCYGLTLLRSVAPKALFYPLQLHDSWVDFAAQQSAAPNSASSPAYPLSRPLVRLPSE